MKGWDFLRLFLRILLLTLVKTEETPITNGNCPMTNFDITTQWRLEIDLKFTGASTGWANILSLQVKHPSAVYGTFGQRIPASKVISILSHM